ncbi:DUF1493 family protein [Brenneria goodwinii]|uniref:DUF1493 family protein n=1 Tax=Brenneria goodwinii TaxID=1109412 RepID=UPI0036E9F8C7
MSEKLEKEVLAFVQAELSAKLQIDSSLTTGDRVTVIEDVYEMIEKYSVRFGVDCTTINWRKYYPRPGIPIIPNFLLPERLKTDHHEPAPLTVRMLVESAKAGRWLYD